MFNKQDHKDASTITLQDIDVHIPAPGWVYDNIESKWKYVGVHKRSHIKREQYWERIKRPENWAQRRREESKEQAKDPDYFEEELEAYREQEWFRRLNGFWFMNNGKPTYITGGHYFFLCHWFLDVGYGDFRITDMEWWYFMKYCEEDNCSAGFVEVTQRRQGKTERACCWAYDRTSRRRYSHCGIQSKTLSDAKDNVYSKKLLKGFKNMVDFFVPIYDMEKGRLPKSGLFFQQTNTKGRSAEVNLDEELNSSITYKSSEVTAYDGEKLETYISDEAGKVIEVDIWKRHQVVQFCLIESGTEPKIIGKCITTTTVEELDSGGSEFKTLWDSSDQNQRNANGRTKSLLYRYFLPASRALYFDKYGFPDEKRALEFHMGEREGLADDADSLASYIRKNPLTISEAFYIDSDKCLFDAMILQSTLEQMAWRDESDWAERGNFAWIGGNKDGRVKWVPSKQGKFLISKRVPNLDDPDSWNRFKTTGTKKSPENRKAVAGVDPFDHKLVEGRKSDGASYLYWKFDESEKEMSESFVVEYIYRTKTPYLFYEDMIMMCLFFGCQILPEDNKIGIVNYFESRGYDKFLGTLDGKKPGVSASGKSHQTLLEEMTHEVLERGHKIEFVNLLRDLLLFDINDTQKFDAAMAAGWTIVMANKFRYKKKNYNPVENNIKSLHDLFG